jgi:NhaP-type Na+/H+ and K+/H+ antiporter
VSVRRGDRVIVPRGDLALDRGDRLTVFSVEKGRPALEELLAARVETVQHDGRPGAAEVADGASGHSA